MRTIGVLISLLLCGCGRYHIHTAFVSPVCIKPYKNYHYTVCHDIHFVIEKQNYTIPKGFRTDLASIPRLAWPIMSPAHSSLIRPAIVHDWFYRKTCEFSRLQTDLIFYHMLKNDGVSTFKAVTLFCAVRLFGGLVYNEDYCDD